MVKTLTLFFTAFLMSLATMAQEPQGINYQTVIRGGDGSILPNTELSLKMIIRSGASDGEIVYAETHEVSTNAFGLANMVIGNGTAQIGTFAGIDWSAGHTFLETAYDLEGNGSYTVLGVTQFLSVPYALESKHASSMTLMDENGNEYEISVDTQGNLSAVLIENEWQCGQIFTDTRDGQTYETVQIDNQCWMAENLAYLPMVSPSIEGSDTDPFYYVGDYQGTNVSEVKTTDNFQNYGALYNWPASLAACPTNWHLPTDAEWTDLTSYLGGESVAGGKMKSTRKEPDPQPRWKSPNTGATNSSGFSGLPGGFRDKNGVFVYVGSYMGILWSSTAILNGNSWGRLLASYEANVTRNNYEKKSGFSVRCLRDIEQQNLPPESPSSPSPENESQNQGVETSLSWTCNDPDGDPLAFDVFFSTEATPAQVTAGQSETTFDPGTIEYNTQYFWQIVAHDNQGNTTEGEVWSFTTEAELEPVIGDEYCGGIIAYILQTGDPGYVEGETHGIIAAANDQSTSAPWGCYGTYIFGADGTELGTGYQNTLDIVAGCSTAGTAAQICNDLELNGYTDWYLPSKDELSKLYDNKVAIGGFADDYYWSSSEFDKYSAWVQFFTYYFQSDYNKLNTTNIRAIRDF